MSPARAAEKYQRHSPGLEQFFLSLQGQAGLRVLDLCPVSQSNVSFISGLGHRLYCEDFLSSLDDFFGEADFYQGQENSRRGDQFLDMTFRQLEPPFQGALVWDLLSFLSPTLLEMTVRELHRLLTPGSMVLAFFHGEEKARQVPASYFRIQDAKTIEVADRGPRTPGQYFSNRAIEKLFEDFDSLKFFLSRDQYREVIIRR